MTLEQQELEAPGHFQPAQAADYFAPGVDMQTRTWFEVGLWSKETGSSLAKRFGQVASKVKTMAPANRDFWAASERSKLVGIYGKDLDAKLSTVGGYINEVEAASPGFKQFLEKSGVLDDAMVVTMFVDQAERLAARQRAKRK